jgi:AAHS family 4-hydroxybenzoate transporter-like MFS transporter
MLEKSSLRATIDVAALVDGQRISRFLIGIILLGFLAQIGDGYDLAAAAYAAPGIVHAWHISRASLAPVFSTSLFGMLFGAPLFGYVGDRYGRRIAIIICSLLLGTFTLATASTHTLLELGVLRFLTGIGLGGLPANTIAIMAEYAPRRSRALLITLMFMGITFGGIVPAAVTEIAPDASWQVLFIVGGFIPVIAAILNLLFMPESLKFLALRHASNPQLVKIARKMRPDISVRDDTEFLFAHQSQTRFSPRMLFAEKLRWITPLVWAMFITNLMANFFLNSWMPTLFRASGLTASQAAFTTSMYYVGGVVGGITISRALDRSGVGIVAIFMLLGVPAVMLLGIVDFSATTLKFAVLFVGITVLGNQLGLNAVLGLVYPTAIRANGSGWALGIGRIGAIVGPLIGGSLIAAHVKLQYLFMVPTVPLFIGAVASALLKFQTDKGLASGEDEMTTKLENA